MRRSPGRRVLVAAVVVVGALVGPLVTAVPAGATEYPSWQDVQHAKGNETAKRAEVQREPAPPPAPTAPVHPPELAHPEHSALPLPAGLSAPLEGMPPAHPEPGGTETAAAVQAGVLGTVPPAVPGEAPAAGSGEAAAEQEEPLPRFDPIPGTVARNAPK